MSGTIRSAELAKLAASLVYDTYHILSEDLQKRLAPANDRSLVANVLLTVKVSQTARPTVFHMLLAQAVNAVRKIYGHRQRKVRIPEAVFYERAGEKADVERELVNGLSDLGASNDLDRDKYNLALNFVVNAFLHDLLAAGIKPISLPKEGLYLRDNDGNLYLHEEVR